MKKNILEIYIYILLFLILNLITAIIQWIFSPMITTLFLILNSLLILVTAISFTLEIVLSLIISGFLVLAYAAYLFIQVFQGNILGSDALGYYIWFMILPIGAFIGGTLKIKFKNLMNEIIHCEQSSILYSSKDEYTLFYNKSEFLTDLKNNFEVYKRKKIYFSTIIISIKDYDLLIEILNKNEKERFFKEFSEGIKKCIKSDSKKYFLEKGNYAVIILGEDEEELKEDIKNIKIYMEDYLKNLSLKNIEKISLKYSSKTINSDFEDSLSYYKVVLKGLEFDV